MIFYGMIFKIFQGSTMNENVYIPFYMPYGMSQEEFEYEVKLAQQKAEEQAFNEQIEMDYYNSNPHEGD